MTRNKPTLEDALELSGIEILHPGGFEITRRIGEIADVKGKKILDVSCGRGVLPSYYARTFGAHVVGIDLNPEMIRSSVERAKKEGVEHLTEFRVADSLALPFEDGSFDVVINECAVGLTSNPQRCMDEMARVARPDGYVVIHESTWLKQLPEERRAEIAGQIGTVPYTLAAWKEMMEKAGLREIWSEDWSGLENALKMRPDRKPRSLVDIFSLREMLTIVLPRLISKYGIGSIIPLIASAPKMGPLYSNGTLGYSLIRGQKRGNG